MSKKSIYIKRCLCVCVLCLLYRDHRAEIWHVGSRQPQGSSSIHCIKVRLPAGTRRSLVTLLVELKLIASSTLMSPLENPKEVSRLSFFFSHCNQAAKNKKKLPGRHFFATETCERPIRTEKSSRKEKSS